LQATDPVTFAECSLSNAVVNLTVKLCVDGLALRDEFVINNAADVESRMSMVFVELRLILAFFSLGDDELFHCDDFVSGSYPWLVHLSVHEGIADYHTHVITETLI
jgi:hypothetical protein